MADFKQHMFQRLRAAKQWLTRAEEAFDKDRDIRAELDLMLAQAELQHVKETSRSCHWRYKYPLIRHSLAFGLAITVIGVGFGGTYWWMHETQGNSVPVPLAVGQSSLQPLPQLDVKGGVALGQQQATVVATPVAAAPQGGVVDRVEPQTSFKGSESHVGEEESRTTDKQVVLSPDEMQKLVRAAGKSLRGQ